MTLGFKSCFSVFLVFKCSFSFIFDSLCIINMLEESFGVWAPSDPRGSKTQLLRNIMHLLLKCEIDCNRGFRWCMGATGSPRVGNSVNEEYNRLVD